jgi:hypothetical protein
MVSALLARVVHEVSGRDVPRRLGYGSAVMWLRDSQRITPADAARLLALGARLAVRPPSRIR